MEPVAVIVPVEGAAVEPTVEAVERQTVTPVHTFVGELSEAPDAQWLWLLDGGVVPEHDALEHLVNAADGGQFALVSSRVLTPDGELDPASAPVPEVHRVDRVLCALDRGAVSLRVARRGSLLVRGEGLARAGFDHDLAWTARLLANHAGILEPKSVAVRVTGEPRVTLADGLRLLVAVEGRERLWLAAHVAERAMPRG